MEMSLLMKILYDSLKRIVAFRSAEKTNGPIIIDILEYESRDHKEKLPL